MADGSGRPRCGVVIVWSGWLLARSELTGESTFGGWGDTRDFANEMRGEKSWVYRPPNSVLDGWEMVSDVDIGSSAKHVMVEEEGTKKNSVQRRARVQCSSREQAAKEQQLHTFNACRSPSRRVTFPRGCRPDS